MNLFVADTEVFVGGYISIPSVYKSPNGPNSYSSDIRAMVFVNGVYEDDADILPRYFPEPGEEDPGQHFVFKSLARGAGFHEIEFVVINGNLSSSSKALVNIIESPLTNNYLFLQNLMEWAF